MIREEVRNPLAGSIGALGISSETCADLGKERRTTTKAPPGEMLIAVANSRESVPFPSRVRIKTGIASCNRAHLRSSLLLKLRGTGMVHHERVLTALLPHLRGQTQIGDGPTWNPAKRRHQRSDYLRNFAVPAFGADLRSYIKSATFFASVPVWSRFPIDSLLHLT